MHADFELEPPTLIPHAGPPPSRTLNEPPTAVSVLLVDDRPENLLALEALLDPLGVRTVRATSGAAAIERVREEEFAVVLLDVMMPDMDGFDTALAIRDLPGVAVTPPIIFLTAANIETRAWTARSYALGAADYLTKPIDADALRSKVTVFVELARARREVERAAAMRAEYARAQAGRAAAERHASQLTALNERLQQQARELAAQSAAALRAGEETRALAESMPQLVWAAQPNGVVDYYNARWYAYTGMPRRDAPDAGDGWRGVLHPEDRAAVQQAWERAVATGDPYEMTARFRAAATGEYRWFLVRALPARDEAGRVTRWFGTCTDVEDQQRAQRGLRFLAEASEALSSSLEYETTLATVARLAVPALADWCAVDIVDRAGRFTRLAVEHPDPAMVALAKELDARYPDDPNARQGRHNVRRTGRSEYMPEITPELLESAARGAEHLEILRRLGLRSYMTVPLLARDGRVLGVITFVSAESGRRYGPADVALAEDLARRAAQAIENAALVREISESRELLEQQATELEMQAEELRESHEELEVSNEELRQTNDELEAARAEADRANRAKAEFLASMSHELRTPLNATLGYVELLEMGIRGPVTEEMRTDLARIQRSQRHLLSLVNDILNFAKLEAGHVEYHIADVRLADTLEELETMVGPQVRAKGLEYRSDRCEPGLAVRADREKLRQVLLNLLTNAVKFTAPGGRVSVACDGDASRVRIAVTDTGRGIAASQLERIFEPFVQVDRHLTHESQQGVGLGLAISRDLVRGMGGSLTAESAVGVGSTFTVSLPRADA